MKKALEVFLANEIPAYADTCRMLGAADLRDKLPGQAITKTDLTGPVQVQSFTRYGLTVTNLGPEVATNVVVTDTLDANNDLVFVDCVDVSLGESIKFFFGASDVVFTGKAILL